MEDEVVVDELSEEPLERRSERWALAKSRWPITAEL